MKIDHLSTTLDVENEVESHCTSNIHVYQRQNAQSGVIDDLHSTTV